MLVYCIILDTYTERGTSVAFVAGLGRDLVHVLFSP